MKIFQLLILLFIFNNCFAQQRIIFLEDKKNADAIQGQSYYLPRLVKCKIKNGRSKKLILVSVKGDTFHFKNITSDSLESTLLYSNIKFIQFRNKTYFANQIIAASSMIASGILLDKSITLYSMKNGTSIHEHYKFALYGVASLISFTLGATLYYKTPPRINSKKYSLFVK